MSAATIRIRPVHYGTSLRVDLGDGPAKVTSAGGGWTKKNRPMNIGLTSWEGIAPIEQDVPILIDDFARERSVEPEVSLLRSLAGIGWQAYEGFPPTAVRIDGPINFPEKKWVIAGIEEGDVLRLPRNRGGYITRYPATLKLIEWVNPDQIRLSRRKQNSTRAPWIYTVKEGDTLRSLAVKFYDDASKWVVLRDAQRPKIRGPRRKLEAGTKLKIPGLDTRFMTGETGSLSGRNGLL